MDVNKEGKKGEDADEADFSALVDEVFQLKTHQPVVDKRNRKQNEDVVEKRFAGEPLEERLAMGADPGAEKKGRPQENQQKRIARVIISPENEDGQYPEVTGKMFNPLLRNNRHVKNSIGQSDRLH